MSIYEIALTNINNETLSMADFKGKVLLIVNTASKCGFTKQFEALQQLYERYTDQGFAVLGFPCNQFLHQDPLDNASIASFCSMNYGITFPMFQKTKVRGRHRHPLFDYLVKNAPVRQNKAIKWNFEKFLIDRHGHIVNRYASKVTPEAIEEDIVQQIMQR